MPALPQSAGRAERDRPVAVACGLGLAAVAVLLVLDFREVGRPPPSQPPLARLAHVHARVLRRPAGTLVWEPAVTGDALRARDSLYVPPDASASVEFAAGARLEVEERSLVVIEPPEPQAPGARLALLQGALSGAAGGSVPLAIRARSGEVAVLDPGGAARLGSGPGGTRLAVLEGAARLGDAAQVAQAGVRLDRPERNQRIWTSRFPLAVALEWNGAAAAGLSVEAAPDPGFSQRAASAPAEPGRFDLQVPEAGSWFWRLTDREGAARSETRRLVVLEDLPPKPFSPMAGEIVLAPPGVQVPFWWTAVDGASRYRLEIAAEPSFGNVAFSGVASGPGLWAPLDLPEGLYYWRVRVDQAERGQSPSSPPSPFRLLRRPLPDAPRLFDPTLEVEHGAAR
ncbi:MAG TPA: hypothetical protein VFR85_05340 [Anaeromyxobacteraceae bacterium]|nr:hypothetical protein [Anaeromyxobacteraceae bacterium]